MNVNLISEKTTSLNQNCQITTETRTYHKNNVCGAKNIMRLIIIACTEMPQENLADFVTTIDIILIFNCNLHILF